MNFNDATFQRFARRLQIESKEQGLRPLFPLLGTQEYLLGEMRKGFEEGIRDFTILKGRQDGVTTICLSLDLFWLYKNVGIHGMMISDNEANRDQFRATLTHYHEGLPPEFKVPDVSHNRNNFVLANRSRLMYRIAGGTRKGTGFRGAGVALVHATECSSYGDESGLMELNASLAKNNPARLYLWESTALGYNAFYDMCMAAKTAVSKRLIFIGWWRNANNAVPRESLQFKTYWDGKLSKEEREWIIDVKKLYGFEVRPEQIAWWRWQFFEYYNEDTMTLVQEHPPTEHMAFVMTGSQWFNSKVLTDLHKWAKTQEFQAYSYHFGEVFTDTIIWPSSPKKSELKLWEEPQRDSFYIISCDPAYGGSVNADRFVVTVSRAYADGLDDVAEFASADIQTFQCAWICCHLAGYFSQLGSPVTLNIEANGPGKAVMDEIKSLRRQASTFRNEQGKDIREAVKHMSWYLFRRPDSLGGPTNYIGTMFSYNEEMKHRQMNALRDQVHRGLFRIRSIECIDEMRTIVKEPPPDNEIHGTGTAKDDRVMARSIAAITWLEQVRPRLEVMKATRAAAEKAAEGKPPRGSVGTAVDNYFQNQEFVARLANMRPHPGAKIKVP